MDSGKTFYILSQIRTTFPCVFCSAAPSSGRVEEAWAALWSVVWVTVQQQSNCGWWGKGTTLADRQRPMQGRWCHAMATTTPRLRVYMKSVVIQSPWKPKPGKKEAWRNRRPASVWPEPLVNLTLKKWAIWIQSNQIIKLAPKFKVKIERKIKTKLYKNDIVNVHNLLISLKSVEIWKFTNHSCVCLYSELTENGSEKKG